MNVKLKTRLRVVPNDKEMGCAGCYFRTRSFNCSGRQHTCSSQIPGQPTRHMIFKEVKPNGN